MNIFSKILLKAFGREFSEPNKLYESFSIGNNSYSFIDRNFTNYIEKGYVENPDVNAVVSRIASSFASIKSNFA